MVIPFPELPDVDEKSIVALFLPEIFTPAGREILPDFTVPLITIVVPFEALLTAASRVVPPFFTSIVFPEVDELELPEPELDEPELDEPLLELESDVTEST